MKRSSPHLLAPIGVAARRSTDLTAVQDRIVVQAMVLIRERACFGLGVNDLLRRFTISRSAFYERFYKALGRSPSGEIRRVRLDRVKSLLSQTTLPLKKISELTGFNDPNYLHVAFKREVGMNPGKFRSQHGHRWQGKGSKSLLKNPENI